jgi:hypothetical protein
MLTEQPILITSIQCKEAGGILKNRFIRFDGTYGLDGAKSLGVVNAATNQNEYVPVTVKGIAVIEAGGPIPLGSAIQSFDDGTAAPAGSGPLEGYAMDVSSSAGQLIRILLS